MTNPPRPKLMKLITEQIEDVKVLTEEKDGKKLPITDNVLIEELLGGDQFGAYGCICIEDIIDTVFKCHDDNLSSVFSEIQKVMWPF